jgi:hypothetical protein
MKKTLILIVPVLFSLACPLYSQLEEDILEHALELITETNNEVLAAEEVEFLSNILAQRENINRVEEQILSQLPFITDFQVYSFLEYRKKYGRIYSVNELYLIPGFYRELVEKFSLLFDFGTPLTESSEEKSYLKQKLLLRLKSESPSRQGFGEGPSDSLKIFKGPNLYRLVKYDAEVKDGFRAGFTLESDAGEKIVFDSLSRGFDLNSAFLEIKNIGKIKKIILGDYKISSSEGLIFSSRRAGKSTGGQFSRSLPRLRKYSSTTEFGFYRGLAAQFASSGFQSTLFLSQKKEGGRLYNDEKGIYFRSIHSDGLYRNLSELSKKKNIRDRSAGLIVSYTSDRFQAGYNLKARNFNPGMAFNRRGDGFSVPVMRSNFLWQSAFYNFQWKKVFIAGELAFMKDGGVSFQQKLSIRLLSLLEMRLGYRNFSEKYYCPGAGSFSETGNPRNERGFYAGIISWPLPFLKIKLYLDQYESPWFGYHEPFPGSGIDFMIDSEWYILRDLDLKILFKTEKSAEPYEDEYGFRYMRMVNSTRIYGQYSYHISENFRTRFRIELKMKSYVSLAREKGILLYKELTWKIPSRSLSLNLRYTVFDIPDWDVRIYTWEHDLLYSFHSPSYYKSGYNTFMNLRWNITKNVKFGLKLAATLYSSKREKGSGSDYRHSDAFYDLKGQIILGF